MNILQQLEKRIKDLERTSREMQTILGIGGLGIGGPTEEPRPYKLRKRRRANVPTECTYCHRYFAGLQGIKTHQNRWGCQSKARALLRKKERLGDSFDG